MHEEIEAQKMQRSARIHRLIETRHLLNNLILKHCQQCYKDTITYIQLQPKEDPLKMDIGITYC
jgi:hypothetical protein